MINLFLKVEEMNFHFKVSTLQSLPLSKTHQMKIVTLSFSDSVSKERQRKMVAE
jgi:hypothetical protein